MTRKTKQTKISASKSLDKSVAKPANPNKTKRNRAEYKRPAKLGELIDIYNLVQVGTELPNITAYFLRKHGELKGDKKDPEYLLRLYRGVVTKCLQMVPEKLREHLNLAVPKQPINITVAIAQYAAWIIDERRHLGGFEAEKIPSQIKMEKIIAELDYWSKLFQQFEQFIFLRDDMLELLKSIAFQGDSSQPQYIRDLFAQNSQSKLSSGKLFLTSDYSAVAIEGLGAIVGTKHLDRLRSCVICQKVFWAQRIEALTCSQKCSNAFHQRKRREKDRDEINAKRRETYVSKKQLKLGKEKAKKNGTL
jgi:hypothetical protein